MVAEELFGSQLAFSATHEGVWGHLGQVAEDVAVDGVLQVPFNEIGISDINIRVQGHINVRPQVWTLGLIPYCKEGWHNLIDALHLHMTPLLVS